MKRIFTLVILLVFVHSVNAQFSSNKYVENELIIWLNPGVSADEFAKNFLQDVKPKQTGLRGKSTKIQTTGWKEGVYVVRVNYNDETSMVNY